MKGVLVGVLAVAAVIALIIPVSALAASVIRYYPFDVMLSPNTSVGIEVVPDSVIQKPYRITWSVVGIGARGIGSFPIENGKGFCYFSNDDENATCGPNPFTSSGEHQILVNIITPSGVVNLSDTINLSDVSLSTSPTNLVDNSLKMKIEVFEGAVRKFDYTVTYQVMDGNRAAVTSARPLDFDANRSWYMGEYVMPASGIYYVLFRAFKGTKSGSAMLRYDIPSTDYLEISAEKQNYYVGGMVKITGRTNGARVRGEVKYPDRTTATDIDVRPIADGSFSYEFRTLAGWPEGNYTIQTTDPLQKTAGFFLSDLLQITPDSAEGTVETSSDFTKTLTVRNMRDVTLNLSVEASGGVHSSDVSLSKTSLSAQESGELRFSKSSDQSGITGKVLLKAGDVQLEIPVEVTVEGTATNCPECPPAGESSLQVTTYTGDKFLSQECVAEQEAKATLKIKNKGTAAMSSFTYELGGGLQYMEDSVTLDVSDVSVSAGDSEEVDLKITPKYSGPLSGSVKVKSGGSSDSLYVYMNCYDDITGDISSAQDDLKDLKASISETLYSQIDDYLTVAEGKQADGEYAAAKENFDKAGTLLSAAKSGTVGPGGGGVDMTIPIIIIVVVIGALVAFMFIRKRRASAEYGDAGYGNGDVQGAGPDDRF
jgi:hypothetical protein